MMTIQDLLDLSKTIAAPLFAGKTYPWEALADIGSDGRIVALDLGSGAVTTRVPRADARWGSSHALTAAS